MSKFSAASRFHGVASLVLTSLLWCATGLGQNISQFDFYYATEGIALRPDGAMWFTDLQFNRIGRIDANGSVTTFPLPGEQRFPEGIALGSDGNLWFTEIGPPGRIGRITTSGVVTEFELPAVNPRPYGITSGPDGNLWFTEQRTNQIGRITTGGVLTEFPVPTASAGLAGIGAGPDGNLWFAEANSTKIGRITTSGTVTEFLLPTANSHPTAVAAGPDGNVWFTESLAPRVGRISPVWIADYNNSQIVRFSPEATTCVAKATTLCLNNGRFRVTTAWKKNDGTTGQGNGVALTPNSGYFWFFDPTNVEVVVKVLNGCSLGGTYWFFAGGLTNVEVTTTVTDTHTFLSKTYSNPLGTTFAPIQDASTFSTCGRASATGLLSRLSPAGGAP